MVNILNLDRVESNQLRIKRCCELKLESSIYTLISSVKSKYYKMTKLLTQIKNLIHIFIGSNNYILLIY
jgi:hypothetical protein